MSQVDTEESSQNILLPQCFKHVADALRRQISTRKENPREAAFPPNLGVGIATSFK